MRATQNREHFVEAIAGRISSGTVPHELARAFADAVADRFKEMQLPEQREGFINFMVEVPHWVIRNDDLKPLQMGLAACVSGLLYAQSPDLKSTATLIAALAPVAYALHEEGCLSSST